MGDKPQPPQLPKDVPEGIRLFFECKRDSVTIMDGALTWITLPDELKSAAKEGAKPKLTIAPGATPGSATITVSLTTKVGIDVSFELPATIKDGQLSVDTSESYLPQGFKDGITQSVKELNDWFKARGKGFGPPAFGKGQVALSKVDLPAPAQTIVPAPVVTPTPAPDIPKPPPPAPVPPEPQAAGIDWSHLAPTREQWDKALEEAKAAQAPPPKSGPPLVGAGGPGGPKAPAGLGGVAWNYIILGITLAILVLAGIIVFAGPSLGLFGSAPTGSPVAGASPTLLPGGETPIAASPSPSPSPTPAPRIVASDDGLVTLTIPDGSAPLDVPITITALGEADAPDELDEIAFRGSFYRIGPADLSLTGPVTIDRRIDLVALGIDPEQNGYPVVTLALRSPAGTWTWLPSQRLSFIEHAKGAPIEYELHTSATLTSIGDVYGFSSGLRKSLRFEPAGSAFTIGDSFSAFVSLDATAASNLPADQQPQLTSVLPFASQDGVIQFGTPNTTAATVGVTVVVVPVTCEQNATVTVGANGTLSPAVIPSDLLTTLNLGTDVQVGFTTGKEIGCFPGDIPGLAITSGCVSVVHQRLGAYPSHLHWDVTFSGNIPSKATLTIVYREGSTGILQFEDIPIVRGKATADTGITSYGTKTIVDMIVYVGVPPNFVTDSAKQIFGPSVTVTSKEENLGGNACH